MKRLSATQTREAQARIFKALSHPDRLRMVEELTDGERCVYELVATVKSAWSTVSRHLSILRAAGVVTDEKRGLQVFYRLALPCVPSFLTCLDTARTGEAVVPRRCGRAR
jgi:ArsR family transcriptional regulator